MQVWEQFEGMSNRVLPGGYLMGSTGERNKAPTACRTMLTWFM